MYNKSITLIEGELVKVLTAVKVRLYPTPEQELVLSRAFGCSRWYWNFALNACIQHYQQTGKSLKLAAYKGMLPQLKKEFLWLKEDCYSAVLQCVAINLNRAFTNFFQGRAKFPKFKSKHGKQSIQYPQNVVSKGNFLSVPKIGEIKAVFHRQLVGRIKTVTISKTPSGKYFASLLLCETESESRSCEGKIIGIDLGVKEFAIVHDGETVTKYANPKHLKRHEKNLARKQQKLARQTKGSKTRAKFRRIVAKVYEGVSNARQDLWHKLSRKLVNESQVIVVENLNVKGMVRNRKLSKAISDAGWGMFVNFLAYKLERKAGKLIEVDRFFPSSKMCSCCGYVMENLPLDVREWSCPSCGIHHDRDGNAALNIRNEGIRILTVGGGNPVSANGACVRPDSREVKGLRAVKLEAYTDPFRAV
ncbi:RNA-guided endonuclease InsQ/TnpB family protein [Microseira sp. BLCC-F43]|uniref:RNA-guided endonuclease InsQ/TnpB family protein n=1 Tax=Microseira sp. BLCC-F43 TaxID=3153602 RepID=UPI0035B927FB